MIYFADDDVTRLKELLDILRHITQPSIGPDGNDEAEEWRASMRVCKPIVEFEVARLFRKMIVDEKG